MVAASLFGCSSSSDDKNPPTDGGAPSNGDSTLAAKLGACPILDTSSDPAASTCLQGTYTGQTLAGEACSVNIKAGGAYDFTTPALSFSYTPADNVIRVFSHTNTAGAQQVLWTISDPTGVGTSYDLDFTARFGQYTQDSDKKITFQATKHVGSAQTSSSCVVAL